MQQIVNILNSIEVELQKVHATLPHLPTEWKSFLTKALPYLVAIGGILSILSILSVLQIFGIPMVRYYSGYSVFALPILLSIISAGIAVIAAFFAFPKLQKNQKLGWTYIFGASLVSGIIGILMFSISSVIGTCIGLYILFEIRENYKS